MKVKNLLLVVFFFIAVENISAQAPNWEWARSAYSGYQSGAGEGGSVATDALGNLYFTVGVDYGSDTVIFGSFVLTGGDIYLAKYDSAGNVLWAKGNKKGPAESSDIRCDASGNCYMTGYFQDTVSFGSYTLTNLVGNLNSGVFLVKYDSSGNVLWAKSAGGTNFDLGNSLATDASGNVFITGSFESSKIIFGSDTLVNAGSEDFFLAKYDSSGNVLWAKSAGGTGVDGGIHIATDASGNEYITGLFSSPTISFGSFTLTSAGGNKIFLVKYDSSGNVLWAKSNGIGIGRGIGVATDALQNVYITGQFTDTVSFGPDTLLVNGGAFISKYDSSGNVLWAKSIQGTIYSWCVATDGYNRIYISGSITSLQITIDTLTLLNPGGPDPMFIAGFDSSGNVLFAKALTSGGDDENAVVVGPLGSIYVGGDFERQHPLIVGRDTLRGATGNGEDVFVAKLRYADLVSNFISSDTVLCDEESNCVNFFDHSTGTPTSWQWHFTGAIPDTSSQQNPTNICYSSAGTYPVTLIVANAVGRDTLTVSPMITVSICLNINDTGAAGGIKIFPNPATNLLHISLNKNIIGGEINIFNVMGEKVYSERLTPGPSPRERGEEIEINCRLAAGVYFVRIIDEDRVYTGKVVIE